MQITLTIPDDLVGPLNNAHGVDLARAALEILALDGYNAGSLSRYQVQRLVGFDNRWDVEEWLGYRGAKKYSTRSPTWQRIVPTYQAYLVKIKQ